MHAWRIVSARFKAVSDQAIRRATQRTLKIGVSARIFHPEEEGKGLRSKTLQYLEESIAQWVMSRDVLVLMIPTVNTNGRLHPSNIRLRDYARHLDGLVLQGGADVSPQTYSEKATRPEWNGDSARDMYELELLHEFVEAGKPVLGICRGCQLINVGFGGTLYQDIATDEPASIAHVNEQYDRNFHAIQFPAGSSLRALLAELPDSAAAPGDPDPGLVVAGLAARAALLRAESRGAHYRTDAPATRPEWRGRILWRRDDPPQFEEVPS